MDPHALVSGMEGMGREWKGALRDSGSLVVFLRLTSFINPHLGARSSHE